MNGDRHIQLPAGVPHRIKTRVIDFDQRTRRDVFTKIESECLENLQAARTIAMGSLNGLRLQLWIIRLFETRKTRLGESEEASGKCMVVFRDCFCEAIIIATGQIYHCTN